MTSKSLNPRDALDAVVILSGAEGDKKLAGDPNADPLLAEIFGPVCWNARLIPTPLPQDPRIITLVAT